MIKENVAEVEARIQAACERAGRRRDEVTSVSYTHLMKINFVF